MCRLQSKYWEWGSEQEGPSPCPHGTYSPGIRNNNKAISLILEGNLASRVTWDPGRQAHDSEMGVEGIQELQPGWE